MEAKDTVIKPEDLGASILKHPDLPMGQAIALEQAEVSFKAGYNQCSQDAIAGTYELVKASKQAGIKEVVDWVYGDLEWSSVFQAKIKEWGIDPELVNGVNTEGKG